MRDAEDWSGRSVLIDWRRARLALPSGASEDVGSLSDKRAFASRTAVCCIGAAVSPGAVHLSRKSDTVVGVSEGYTGGAMPLLRSWS